MLTATLGAQCMLWQTSPAATEMETRMMQWLASMIDLPKFSGVIQDSASSATLCALLTARKATSWKTNELGFMTIAKKLIVYTSKKHIPPLKRGQKLQVLVRIIYASFLQIINLVCAQTPYEKKFNLI